MRLVPESNDQNSNDPTIIEVDSRLLRDYFAAQAIRLFTMDENSLNQLRSGLVPNHQLVADFCYTLADAMLARRNR